MSRVSIATARTRYPRHRSFIGLVRGKIGASIGIPRLKRMASWLAAKSATLTGTGTSQDFTTTDPVAANGVLTLTGNAVADETVTIGSTVYTFKAAVAAAFDVLVGINASDSIASLVAAINQTTSFATGTLTLTSVPGDAETVTLGSTVYTFNTVLGGANSVLIGGSASAAIDNLVAAITGGAGEGTVYGTGTVANADATAVAGAGDTMDATGLILSNNITSTETLSLGSWTGVTLTGAAGAGFNYGVGTSEHPDVVGADGVGDTMDATAKATGVAGNSVATVETMTNGSWGAATLENGDDGTEMAATAHGFTNGSGPFVLSTTDTLPAGFSAGTFYWASSVNANVFKAHHSQADALNTERAVVTTDQGAGTQSIAPATTEAAMTEYLKQGLLPVQLDNATDVDDIVIY